MNAAKYAFLILALIVFPAWAAIFVPPPTPKPHPGPITWPGPHPRPYIPEPGMHP